jgi:hypothetical protein
MVETGGTPELRVYQSSIRQCQTVLADSGVHHSQGDIIQQVNSLLTFFGNDQTLSAN